MADVYQIRSAQKVSTLLRRGWTRPFRWLAIVSGLVSASAFLAAAPDKSGVSPNTISLPKGPGSIEGLGESFQPTLNTGTASHAIPLEVPPGTAGMAPQLSLRYEGGGANGPLGFGWSFFSSSIQRRTDRGIPLYGEPNVLDRTDTFINEMKEELVPTDDGFYFCKNEGAFVRYRFRGDHWEGTLPNGTRLAFGLTKAGRIQDTNSAPAHVFTWLLERETDTHGNTIAYKYRSFDGDENANQKYLSSIQYGPGSAPWSDYHFIVFHYEDRADAFEDCRSGFPVRTGKRLREIVVGTQGPTLAGHAQGDFDEDGKPDNLVRRYDLGYLEYAGTNTHWSLLARVVPVGADGVQTLPPSTFGYTVCAPADVIDAAGKEIGGVNEPFSVMDNELVDLIDLNGDGLPDILKTDAFGGQHTAFINAGERTVGAEPGGQVIQWRPASPIDPGGGGAFNFNLNAASTHLADMNGDGLADLVHNTGLGEVFFFANRGKLAWTPRQALAVKEPLPPSPFGHADVRTADIDFDKRIDLIQSIPGIGYRVWFNLGGQRYSTALTIEQQNSFDFTDPSVQIADFNGDRVPDIGWVRPFEIILTVGLGYGRFSPPRRVAIPDFPPVSSRRPDDTLIAKAKLTDVNGDGLADLVIERVPGNECWYWINLGNDTLSQPKVITGMPVGVGLKAAVRWADLNGNGTTDLVYADSESSPRLRTIDLGELINCGPAPNRLSAIASGIGRVTLIGYAPSTQFALDDAAEGNPWPDPIPFPVQVVNAVTNLDSLGHTYVTRFRFHNGYYDPVEKQFRGFARVEQIDMGDATAPTLVTRSYFDTGRDFEAMKGKLLRLTTEQEDGAVFEDNETTWTIPPAVLYTGTNGTNVVFAHPTGIVKLVNELGQGTERRLETETDFDTFGNQTRSADYGVVEDGDRSAFNDERITVTEYAINTDRWILRLPKRAEVQDENGAVISRSEIFYDDETFAGDNLGSVTIGNLTLKREWIDSAVPSAFVMSARTKYDFYGNPVMLLDPLAAARGGVLDASQGHARELAYDARFHTYPIAETILIGQGSDPLVFQADYDEGFGTVASSADFNSNTTFYSYDVFARLTSIVKPGDTLEYPTAEYDYALAVPTDYWSADGLVRSTGIVNFIETRHRDQSEIRNPGSEMYFRSRQFVDGLGRKLMTKTEAEPAPGTTSPRVVISEATLFNARQQLARVLNPCFAVSGTQPSLPLGGEGEDVGDLDSLLSYENIEAPGWQGQFHNEGSLIALDLTAAHATRNEYDATLRSTRMINPDATFRRTVYEPLLTRSFDENDSDPASPYHDTPMVNYNDGLGRLIQVDEVNRLNEEGSRADTLRAWATRYEYDLNDQLTRITDSQNNVKTFAYDGLERKIHMNDPDRGVMHFLYDDASNLIETTDAKRQRITYTYDGANRIRTEKYHGGQFSPPWRGSRNDEALTNSVVYHYDKPFADLPQGDNTLATARNLKGALAWVEDLSGEEHTSYDSRGRAEWVVKRIPDPKFLSLAATAEGGQDGRAIGVGLVSYKTAFAYDSLDRVTRLTYPDLDEITYQYNARNLLQRIPGGPSGSIISNILYQPSGQNKQIEYGNGVRTTYAYDSRLRLKNLLTVPQPATLNRQLINFGYDFDGVSNIKSIADLRPGSAVPEGDPRRNTQLFRYDDLYRLTHVQYSFALPSATPRNDGEINYCYDRIGNMLSKTSNIEHYEKGVSVTQLGDMDYGGTAGRHGRVGRQLNDPPGPHALTSVSRLSTKEPKPQVYPYDANGNMTDIDGLLCTWDFKDRLVAVENTEMHAAYAYDYTDRRILKDVAYKPGSAHATNLDPRITALYINKFFEVRDHDAPIKYVWNGNTRVGRVTGSLNTNFRVQRLRLWPGWNLRSLAITGPLSASGAEGQGEVVSAASRWNVAAQDWESVATNITLPSGTVLWLRATTNATLTLTGIYTIPRNRKVPATGAFLPSASLEAWNFKSAISNLPSATAWTYDTSTTRWLSCLPPPLERQADMPAFIAPGEAAFARADATAHLETPQISLQIIYYHPDHLTSSLCLSDAAGRLIRSRAFYPYGTLRLERKDVQFADPYQFSQNETDIETGMSASLTRDVLTRMGRFISLDRLQLKVPAQWLAQPKHFGGYAYGFCNPLRFVDPEGTDANDVFAPTDVEMQMGTVLKRDNAAFAGMPRSHLKRADASVVGYFIDAYEIAPDDGRTMNAKFYVRDKSGYILGTFEGSLGTQLYKKGTKIRITTGGLATGEYSFNTGQHKAGGGPKSVAALHVNRGGKVATKGPNNWNLKLEGKYQAEGVHIHPGLRGDKRTSLGCPNIKQEQYRRFISLFPSGTKGTLNVVRWEDRTWFGYPE